MALESEKEIQQLRNRFRELAERSYRQNIYTFSGFLGLSEQDIFWKMEKELCHTAYQLWGGAEKTERKLLRFGSVDSLGYEEPYPIVCVHIKPLAEKFSDDFSHRDFLGALMHLGIERSTLGDIRTGSKEGYLFCLDTIADFICRNLEKVKHTSVTCDIVEKMADLPKEEPQTINIMVSSERIDACIAKVYHRSRNEVIELFRAGKVYADGRLCENNSRILKYGETINVRGYGKFVYEGVKSETRKGNLSVQVFVFS